MLDAALGMGTCGWGFVCGSCVSRVWVVCGLCVGRVCVYKRTWIIRHVDMSRIYDMLKFFFLRPVCLEKIMNYVIF